MDTVAENLDIKTPDGTMTGFAFRPDDDQPHPAVIVIQEIFDVDNHIKDVARRFAAEGYYAVAPDLFYREGAGLIIPYENRDEAFRLRSATTPEGLTADLNALMAHLKSDSRASQRVGIVGYCFGGGVGIHGYPRSPRHSGGGHLLRRRHRSPRRRSRRDVFRPRLGFQGGLPGHRLLGGGGPGHSRCPRQPHRRGP